MLGSLSAQQLIPDANSVYMLPIVSAEWNQNMFLQPYVTTAGDGTLINWTTQDSSATTETVNAKPNFTTKKIISAAVDNAEKNTSMATAKATYIKNSLSGNAYKIITYVKTNSQYPILVNTYAKSAADQYGSKSEEVVSYKWTKIETVIGSDTTISDFTYVINAVNKKIVSIQNKLTDPNNFELYFTVPEIYETTQFDYENGSLWTTSSPFEYFRPGESYVTSGNSLVSSITRSITSIKNYSLYAPCSRVMYNPNAIVIPPPKSTVPLAEKATAQNPLLKNGMLSDMSLYKYFVSDKTSKKITAKYETDIYVNKVVIKFNNIISQPTVDITIGSNTITSQQPASTSGILVLYWNGSSWTTSKWSTVPKFDSQGNIALKTSINKISLSQTASTLKTEFNVDYFDTEEFQRMHVIEISPRLEVDLTDFITSVNINKSLDNNNNPVPISSLESNDASITLSGIPAYSIENGTVPIFSNDSSLSSTILKNMLKKNVKFYLGFNLLRTAEIESISESPEYIPGGVFYADSWEQNDIDTVSVQCLDITKYLQSRQVQDYAAQFMRIEDVITNILDFAGFTDYDYDSLITVCSDLNVPMDFAYYFAGSTDKTVFEALREIFAAYQIGAYIDEYGIMKFLSLSKILQKTSTNWSINDGDIVENGYSLTTSAKPGKISMRYNPPQIKTTAAIQNIQDPAISESPSFVITTQNDVVWQQQNSDSCGFNYLSKDMDKDDTYFELNVSDLLDIFHTYPRNFDGYAAIEDEIVSFKYKEYTISKASTTGVNDPDPETVSIKNDLELKSLINKFEKENMIGVGKSRLDNGTDEGLHPYDVVVSPTGRITNVQRGMFGTKVKDHFVLAPGAAISEKNLVSKKWTAPSFVNNAVVTVNDDSEMLIETNVGTRTFIFDNTEVDQGYKTYSTSFSLKNDTVFTSAGVFFNLDPAMNTMVNTYFVELVKDSINDKYFIYVSQTTNDAAIGDNVLGKVDVTSIMKRINYNFPQAFKINQEYTTGSTTINKYKKITDQTITLKVVHKTDDPGNESMNLDPIGNISGDNYSIDDQIIRVFLNDVEITAWGKTNFDGEILVNSLGLPVSLALPAGVSEGTKFGIVCGGIPNSYNDNVETPIAGTGITATTFSEIYAVDYPLEEESDFYYHKTQYFLNAIAMNRKNIYKSYYMQTRPSASAINFYDVNYTTPAATVVDVLPIEYLIQYYPTSSPEDRTYKQSMTIRDSALKYSVPVNTGFRGKMIVANNSRNAIFLNIDATDQIVVDVKLNLWTRQIIATSDEQIVDIVIDPGNASETIQIDSQWIQSEDAANAIINTIMSGLDGFSKDISIEIFGNPLIQVGDTVSLTYSLAGVSNKLYVVQSVSQGFSEGLSTNINLKQIR